MSDEEVRELLATERVVSVATMGRNARPHLVPLFYVSDGLDVLVWTYGSSQKVRNLERDPRATIMVEAGEKYDELRGVMLECDVEIERDPGVVLAYGLKLAGHYGNVSQEARETIVRQAAKRVVLRFRPSRVVSWDHRKMAAARGS